MADIELVIKIPELYYKELITTDDFYLDILEKTVKNGTPLPKGHGALIDRRELKKEVYTTTEWNGDIHRIICETSIDDAPTIIEGSNDE